MISSTTNASAARGSGVTLNDDTSIAPDTTSGGTPRKWNRARPANAIPKTAATTQGIIARVQQYANYHSETDRGSQGSQTLKESSAQQASSTIPLLTVCEALRELDANTHMSVPGSMIPLPEEIVSVS
jgi:hypothetical protein